MENLINQIQNEHKGLTLAQATKVAEARTALQNGVVKLTFKKADGTIRVAERATTSNVLTKGTLKGTGKRHVAVTPFFDLEIGAWRSFNWENLISFENVD